MRQGADSLFEMARRACGRYSARITDIGDLDYDLIRPVLLKIESPEKLVSATATMDSLKEHQLTENLYSTKSNKHLRKLLAVTPKYGCHSSNETFRTGSRSRIDHPTRRIGTRCTVN